MNFCVECKRRERAEQTEVFMDKYGLTDEALVSTLAGFIVAAEPNLGAVKVALGMKGMIAPQKVEATVEEKGTDASKLAAVLAKLAAHK